MERKFNRPATGLNRDKDGHRTGMKFQVKMKVPMSQEGYNRWGHKQKKHISKHRYVYKTFHSTKQAGLPDGIPIQYLTDDRTMGKYLIDLFYLQNGETYSFHGYTCGKTRSHVKLTKTLFELEVHNADEYKFTIKNAWRFNRYWFKKGKKHTRREI